MSLVNKMLRDLDARRAGDSDRASLPAAVSSLAAHQRANRGISRVWLVLPVLAAGIVALAWYAMQLSSTDVPLPAPAPRALVTPEAVAAIPATLVVVEPPAPAPSGEESSLRRADQLSTLPAPMAETPRQVASAPKAADARVADTVPARPPLIVLPRVPPVAGAVRVDRQAHLPSAAERAESEYRRGIQAQRQGHLDEAAGSYRAALADFSEHAAARQTLAALLIEAKRFDEAEELLRKGVELAPVRLASALALARLKVERNQAGAALELLLGSAAAGERSAEFQGFVGALLNRAGRAAEAVERYQAATRLAPTEGRWWAGLGIALEAAGKGAEAREAYQRARAAPGLPADLAQYIEQRLH